MWLVREPPLQAIRGFRISSSPARTPRGMLRHSEACASVVSVRSTRRASHGRYTETGAPRSKDDPTPSLASMHRIGVSAVEGDHELGDGAGVDDAFDLPRQSVLAGLPGGLHAHPLGTHHHLDGTPGRGVTAGGEQLEVPDPDPALAVGIRADGLCVQHVRDAEEVSDVGGRRLLVDLAG